MRGPLIIESHLPEAEPGDYELQVDLGESFDIRPLAGEDRQIRNGAGRRNRSIAERIRPSSNSSPSRPAARVVGPSGAMLASTRVPA